ncbi:hypothetical protein FQN60_000449 [Etheostoma spectabile]|uniref:RRM domain-containing protein n=1 Tax=Etheostoma spectabile TaxID=54343 RepID=A0A5J5D0F4_9PERO|nr:hypothetical protein FQN60_000449 [Etheostoma spectabile]
MCSQEAVLRPGGALSSVWGTGSWSEKPPPVPGPTGWGEGAGQLAGAGPNRHRDPASHGVCAAPGAKQQRLQVIRDKIEARAELLSRPQRFAASRPLSRREMEIERALFQGTDRLGFLTALYHRDEDNLECQEGASSSDPMDSLYRDVLSKERKPVSLQEREKNEAFHLSKLRNVPGQLKDSHRGKKQPEEASDHQLELLGEKSSPSVQSESSFDPAEQLLVPDRPGPSPSAAPPQINISQPIGSLCGAAKARSGGPLTVKGEIETITDEEILKSRESEEGIQSIPRFRNYQPGIPSKLVALFSRFEQENGPPVLYRLLTGRMKGQAFLTLPDAETAKKALQLVHGYRLLGKPLVVEFGRERQEEEKQKEKQKETK